MSTEKKTRHKAEIVVTVVCFILSFFRHRVHQSPENWMAHCLVCHWMFVVSFWKCDPGRRKPQHNLTISHHLHMSMVVSNIAGAAMVVIQCNASRIFNFPSEQNKCMQNKQVFCCISSEIKFQFHFYRWKLNWSKQGRHSSVAIFVCESRFISNRINGLLIWNILNVLNKVNKQYFFRLIFFPSFLCFVGLKFCFPIILYCF